MKKVNLKHKRRQSGKTYKLIGKMMKHISKDNNPVYITVNNSNADIVAKRISELLPMDLSSSIAPIKAWDEAVNLLTKVIILDDFEFYSKSSLKAIMKYAKNNKIKVIGYSTTREQDKKCLEL